MNDKNIKKRLDNINNNLLKYKYLEMLLEIFVEDNSKFYEACKSLDIDANELFYLLEHPNDGNLSIYDEILSDQLNTNKKKVK